MEGKFVKKKEGQKVIGEGRLVPKNEKFNPRARYADAKKKFIISLIS